MNAEDPPYPPLDRFCDEYSKTKSIAERIVREANGTRSIPGNFPLSWSISRQAARDLCASRGRHLRRRRGAALPAHPADAAERTLQIQYRLPRFTRRVGLCGQSRACAHTCRTEIRRTKLASTSFIRDGDDASVSSSQELSSDCVSVRACVDLCVCVRCCVALTLIPGGWKGVSDIRSTTNQQF